MKVVLMSGGLDSSILLYEYAHKDEPCRAIWIDYGQANAKEEMAAAEALCKLWEVALLKLDAHTVFESEKGYMTLLRKGARHTVASDELANRNAILISIAAHYMAYSPATLLVGAHKTAAPYPDCTERFYRLMDKLTAYSTKNMVHVDAPYIKMTKQSIVRRAFEMAMTKAEIDKTVSCYDGTNCGKCPACIARKAALRGLFDK